MPSIDMKILVVVVYVAVAVLGTAACFLLAWQAWLHTRGKRAVFYEWHERLLAWVYPPLKPVLEARRVRAEDKNGPASGSLMKHSGGYFATLLLFGLGLWWGGGLFIHLVRVLVQ